MWDTLFHPQPPSSTSPIETLKISFWLNNAVRGKVQLLLDHDICVPWRKSLLSGFTEEQLQILLDHSWWASWVGRQIEWGNAIQFGTSSYIPEILRKLPDEQTLRSVGPFLATCDLEDPEFDVEAFLDEHRELTWATGSGLYMYTSIQRDEVEKYPMLCKFLKSTHYIATSWLGYCWVSPDALLTSMYWGHGLFVDDGDEVYYMKNLHSAWGESSVVRVSDGMLGGFDDYHHSHLQSMGRIVQDAVATKDGDIEYIQNDDPTLRFFPGKSLSKRRGMNMKFWRHDGLFLAGKLRHMWETKANPFRQRAA